MSILAVLTLYGCSDEKSTETCGNGKLDNNEACDGELFRANLRQCPGSTEISTLVVCTPQCKLDTTQCPELPDDACLGFTPSCDEANGWLKACANNKIERQQCVVGSEKCDPTKGCVNIQGDPDPCDGFKPYCTDGNIWHTCTNKAQTETTCQGDTPKCDPVKGCVPDDAQILGQYKCENNQVVYCNEDGNCAVDKDCSTNDGTCKEESDEDTTFAYCEYVERFACEDNQVIYYNENGDREVETDCSTNGGTCKEESDGEITIANCEYVERFACEDNQVIYYNKKGEREVETDCLTNNGTCKEKSDGEITIADCVPAETVSCKDDNTVILNGVLEHDCSTNANDNVICNPEVGCHDSVCKEDTLYLYARNADNSIESIIVDKCDPGMCSNKSSACVDSCNAEDFTKCSEDKKTVYMCSDNLWQKYNVCAPGWSCTDASLDTGDCEHTTPCGDGVVETDEQCDPGGVDGAAPSTMMKTCAQLWGNTKDDYVYLGYPGCQSTCKYDSSVCVKSKDVETSAEAWPLTATSEFGGKYKSVIKIYNQTGSFTTSKVESGYWNIGGWSTSSTAQFDNFYIQITPETVTKLSDKTSASIHLNLAQNKTGAAKKVQLAFYNNGTKIETSRIVDVTTTPTDFIFPIKSVSKYTEGFSFRITGFGAQTTSGGTLRIKDMAIYTYTAE